MLTKSLVDAAREYLSRGWAPIPVPFRSKKPVLIGWPDLRLTEDELVVHFDTGPSNIGLLLGEHSGGLVDIDLDAPEAIALAADFLPPTGMIHGRISKPRSHWWFMTSASPKTERFADTDTAVLVEIRSTGAQTLVPPSIHPCGEPIRYEAEGSPASVDGEDLRKRVSTLAACSLLARHWPSQGSRHYLALALAGGLLRSGWSLQDTERFITVAARAAGDEEWMLRARDVRDTAASLDAATEVTGWPSAVDILGAGLVDRLRHFLMIPATIGVPPSSPVPESIWPAPPASEALHGLAGDIVRAIEPHTEADPVALLIQVLIAFGNVIGRAPHFTVEADGHHMNAFAVLVGASSKGRKGTSWGQAKLPFQSIDSEWATNGIKSGLSSGEGLIWSVRDEITRRDAIKVRGKVTGYETVIADPGVSDKRLLVLEPEFSSTLKVIAREGNTLSPLLRQAFDTGLLRTLTKNSPAVATGAHISIISHITKDELLRHLDRTEMANGFANRFLWLCVRRSKLLPRGGQITSVDFGPILRSLQAATEFARTVGEMHRDEGAWLAWENVYEALSEGRPGLLGAILSRAEAQVTRLSCMYALLDRSNMVRREHMIAALALWEYCESSSRFIFGNAVGDPVADAILGALRARPLGMTRTEIRDFFGRNKSAEEISRALRVLLEQGLVTVQQESTGGRSAERWFATRPGTGRGGTTTTT